MKGGPWFFMDLISSLPSQSSIGVFYQLRILKTFRLARVTKIGKIFRTLRITKIMKGSMQRRKSSIHRAGRTDPVIVRLGEMVLVMLLLWHFLGCLYFGVSWRQYRNCRDSGTECGDWILRSELLHKAANMPSAMELLVAQVNISIAPTLSI